MYVDVYARYFTENKVLGGRNFHREKAATAERSGILARHNASKPILFTVKTNP